MKSKGFTIIELLIVIVIIGILLALIFVGVNQGPKEEKSCSDYADTKVEDLPARCLDYFKGSRGM